MGRPGYPTPPARGRCIAASCLTPTPVVSWAGQSTSHRTLRWALTRSAWRSRLDSGRLPSRAPSSIPSRARNLANAMFEYLEIWHNRKRRHSQLGWLTPIEFERNRIITVA